MMMMSQDPQEQGTNQQEKPINDAQAEEQGKTQEENPINEAKAEAETLNKELPSVIPDQEHLLLEHSRGQQPAAIQSQSQSQSKPPMPSNDMMRHSIADSLMEMLVNMTHSQYLHECLQLLEASDPLQARSQILNILQRIDEKRS